MRFSRVTLAWTIEQTKCIRTGRIGNVVTMNTNPVNAIGLAWLDDMDKALVTVRDSKLPAVITGLPTSSTFCAGLDLVYLFGIADKEESRKRTHNVLTRLGNGLSEWLALPVPTVAALGGHALAGGAVLGNCCDFRVGVKGSPSQFGAIEVPVGVPFPTFAFMTTFAATPATLQRDAILLGRRFGHDEAATLGLFKRNAESRETLIEEALSIATEVPDFALPAYALVKEQFTEPLLKYIRGEHERVFAQVLEHLFSPAGWTHIRGTVEAMKLRKKQ